MTASSWGDQKSLPRGSDIYAEACMLGSICLDREGMRPTPQQNTWDRQRFRKQMIVFRAQDISTLSRKKGKDKWVLATIKIYFVYYLRVGKGLWHNIISFENFRRSLLWSLSGEAKKKKKIIFWFLFWHLQWNSLITLFSFLRRMGSHVHCCRGWDVGEWLDLGLSGCPEAVHLHDSLFFRIPWIQCFSGPMLKDNWAVFWLQTPYVQGFVTSCSCVQCGHYKS